MSDLIQEFRHIVRKLRRRPGFTALATLTLAIGVAANVAVFSVVYGVLIQPLPFPEPDDLVGLWHSAPGLDIPQFEQAFETYVHYRNSANSFQSVGLLQSTSQTLTEVGEPSRISIARATSSIFEVLGVAPLLGRTFGVEEDAVDGTDSVILSYGTWRSRFGSDPDVLGQTIQLNGNTYEIVGVMPDGMRDLYGDSEMWIPLQIDESLLPTVSFSYQALARLNPGATVESAQAELDGLLREIPDVYPGGMTIQMIDEGQMSALVHPLSEDIIGDVSDSLWILLATVGLVLLIACANVANLFMVRAEAQQQEVAVRKALGASTGRIHRNFFGESLVLSVLGGALGVALAAAGVSWLVAAGPGELPRLDEVGLQTPVIVFAGLVSVLAGLIFGLVTAWKYSAPHLPSALKEGGRGGMSSGSTLHTRNVLVGGQVAVALILLVGSGLLVRTVGQLVDVDPGFDQENLLTFRVSLPGSDYPTSEEARGFYDRLDQRIEALSGVERSGSVNFIPLADGQSNNATLIEDFPPAPGSLPEVIRTVSADDDYFETMGIPVVAGRPFEVDDDRIPSAVTIISENLAIRLWGAAEAAVGRRVARGQLAISDSTRWATIVGVVGNVHDTALDEPADEMIYFPHSALDLSGNLFTAYSRALTVKTAGPPMNIASAVRDIVRSEDSAVPIIRMQSMDEVVRSTLARKTFTMVLLGISALVAVLLGTVGLYGVIAYTVAQRAKEIGLRIALGAQEGDIHTMIVRQGLRVAMAGVAVGLVGAFFLTRAMASLLFGVSPNDPLTFATVPILLAVISAGASYLPARRAARLEPLEALRSD